MSTKSIVRYNVHVWICRWSRLRIDDHNVHFINIITIYRFNSLPLSSYMDYKWEMRLESKLGESKRADLIRFAILLNGNCRARSCWFFCCSFFLILFIFRLFFFASLFSFDFLYYYFFVWDTTNANASYAIKTNWTKLTVNRPQKGSESHHFPLFFFACMFDNSQELKYMQRISLKKTNGNNNNWEVLECDKELHHDRLFRFFFSLFNFILFCFCFSFLLFHSLPSSTVFGILKNILYILLVVRVLIQNARNC